MARLRRDKRTQCTVGHQCAHSLQIDSEHYLRKSTRIHLRLSARVLANDCGHLSLALSLRCPGDHEHAVIEGQHKGKHISELAQVWTPKMARRIYSALCKDYQRPIAPDTYFTCGNPEFVRFLDNMQDRNRDTRDTIWDHVETRTVFATDSGCKLKSQHFSKSLLGPVEDSGRLRLLLPCGCLAS